MNEGGSQDAKRSKALLILSLSEWKAVYNALLWPIVRFISESAAVLQALLDAGANTEAQEIGSVTPWDFIQLNDALKGTDAYWLLKGASKNCPFLTQKRLLAHGSPLHY